MRRITAPRIFKHWNRNLFGKGKSNIPIPPSGSFILLQDGKQNEGYLLQQDGTKLALNLP